MRVNRVGLALLCACAVLLPSCNRDGDLGKPPPRSDSPIVYAPQTSSFTVPLTLNADLIRSALEQQIPGQLYTLRQHVSKCIPSQRVKVLGAKIPVTPKLACDVAVDVRRGPLRLTGSGQKITILIPIRAHATASNIAGVIHESANGAAMARVDVRLGLTPDWRLTGKLNLDYDWTKPPTVRFLGQNFTFADRVDPVLKPIIAGIERKLPAELSRINVRGQVAKAWQSGFTVFSLNKDNPPVWMRITPSKPMFGGYSIRGNAISLALGIQGATETFVGAKPDPQAAIPLPGVVPLDRAVGKTSLFVPVIASYDQIEPVILKALVKRSQRPFMVPKIGPLVAHFDRIQAYATDGGRVAVGITLSAWPQAKPDSASQGTVWLTGELINPEDTRTLSFRNLRVNGVTDSKVTNILLRVANHPSIAPEIAAALTQNLEKDYDELRGKIDRAISSAQEGDFVIHGKIATLRSGSLKPAGQGLYLPVWADGQTSIEYRPR